MPKLTINGIEVEVEQGTSIIQAAEQIGIEIPRFCYHDKLSVPANCRMCLVEVEGGPPKPVASCAMACGEGMVVKTDTEMVHKARKGVMEFLLINHPLDCPICDQGGECDLQDQAVAYGYDRSRYHENKRAVADKELGPLIKTTMTRCIQCTRCVRLGEEVAGVTELGLMHRGEDVEIDTFVEKAVSSEMSGNMIDVCPVGALTSKPYEFKARPWELSKTESIDVHDAVGSNVRIDARGGEVMRVLPRLHEEINEEWISDKTRFAYDGLKKRRLDRPWIKNEKTGKLEEADWNEAFTLIAEKMKSRKADKRAFIAGDMIDVEAMVAAKDLAEAIGGAALECRIDGATFDTSSRSGYLFNTSIAATEEADAILLVGVNPRTEAAMINARILKAVRHNKAKVGVIGKACDLNYAYDHIGTTAKDLEAFKTSKAAFAKAFKAAKKPMIILGMGALQGEDGQAVHALAHDIAKTYKVVKPEWNGFNMLHNAASRVGALDVGFAQDDFYIGDASFVYLLGADFDTSFLNSKAFVVYQGHHGDLGAHRADVILPGAAYTEKTALYVNTEGRVQQTLRAVMPPGDAREDWTILRALSAFLNTPLPYNTHQQLRDRIVKEWAQFGTLDVVPSETWEAFGKKGKISKDVIGPAYENIYMTNAICRASETMKACTQEFFLSKQEDMAEAAE